MFIAKEAELTARLDQARSKYSHHGNRGDAAEVAFREFLSDHVSRRLDVGQGEVIDVEGNESRQLDVVIATDDHPFHDPPSEPGLYIAEGVYAAGEVKSTLTTAELTDVVAKGQSVKKLRKLPMAPGAVASATDSDGARWIDGPPPFFAFAYETHVAVKTLLSRLHEAGEPTPVDAIFILGKGAAINFGDGHGARYLRDSGGSKVSGWAWTEGIPSLVELLSWLHALPRVHHLAASPFVPYIERILKAGPGVKYAVPQADRASEEDTPR